MKRLKRLIYRYIQILRSLFLGIPEVDQLRMKLDVPESIKYDIPQLAAAFHYVEFLSVEKSEWLGLLNSSGDFGTLDKQALQVQILDCLIPGTAIFVKGAEGMVGCASVCAIPSYYPYAVLMYVVVLPTHRGAGIGRLVTMKAIAEAVAAGYRKILLHTDDNRLAAISLYLKLGFKPVYQKAADRMRWEAIFEKLNLFK